LQLTARAHLVGITILGRFDPNADVVKQLPVQAFLEVAGRQKPTLPASQRGGVNRKDHRHGWLFHRDNRQRTRSGRIPEGVADKKLSHPGHRRDIPRLDQVPFHPFQAVIGIDDAERSFARLAIGLEERYLLTASECPVDDLADADAAHVVAVVQVGDQKLERCFGIIGRGGDSGEDGFKQGNQIPPLRLWAGQGDTRFGVGVKHRKIELLVGGIKIDEKIVNLVEDFLDASVRPVDLIDHDNGRQPPLKRLAEHKPSLG